MKRYFILQIFVLAFMSCTQTSPFTFQPGTLVDFEQAICIAKDNCLYFDSDSNLFYMRLYYSDKRKPPIDSVEFSPYKSAIYSFKSQKNNSYIVLWETEYEYAPTIKIYYIANRNLLQIGDLPICSACQSYESFEYPIKDIQIVQNNAEIEFSFLTDVAARDNDSEDWKIYEAGKLKYCFNTVNKDFRKVIR
jgi:hypothetical protein